MRAKCWFIDHKLDFCAKNTDDGAENAAILLQKKILFIVRNAPPLDVKTAARKITAKTTKNFKYGKIRFHKIFKVE